MLRLENVSVIFGPSPLEALDLMDQGLDRASIFESTGQVVGVGDASVDINEGEICVFMGLSGSGKSTLLRCINALCRPARGSVTIEDKNTAFDVGKCTEAELRNIRRERISMVFQDFGLLPWRTVRQNVAFALEIRGVEKSQINGLVDDKLRLVELEKWADSKISELSGGMQQRVGLARALATDADILLLDEPFSALDPIIRRGLQDELLELQSKLNKTIVFVTHDLDEAIRLGNKVVIMDQGKIVQVGKSEEIILKPANDYVKKFVSNINPLNVFTAATVMTPLKELARPGKNTVEIDTHTHVTLNEKNDLIEAESHGTTIPILSEPADGDKANMSLLVRPAETTLQELLSRLNNPSSAILICEDKHLLGVVRGSDVLKALDAVN